MSFWVAGSSAVISAAGSAISANSAKKQAQGATAANERNVRATNEMNERLFHEGRGSVGADGFGHSLLPEYFGGNEQDLGRRAYDQFVNLSGLAQGSGANLARYQGMLSPSLDSSLQGVADRFNGNDLAQRLKDAQNTYTSRVNAAQVNSSAINTGLLQTLARLNAQRAAQGYVGNSTFDRNRLAAAMVGARQNAAQQMAAAQYANAADERQLRASDMDIRSNPSLLAAAFSSAGDFYNAPVAAQAGSFSNAMSPLGFFKMPVQSFQQQNMPSVSPGIGSGQIYGGLLGSAASTIGNTYLNSRLQDQFGSNGQHMSYGQFQNLYGGGSPPSYTPVDTSSFRSDLGLSSYTPVQTDWSSLYKG